MQPAAGPSAGPSAGPIAGPSRGPTTLEDLPEAVLLKVFEKLPMPDRGRAMRVSKQWERVLSDNSLWRDVDLLEYRLDLRTMRRIVRTRLSRCLVSLKIRGFADPGDANSDRRPTLSDALLLLLSACCSELKVLHLYECRTSEFSFNSLPASITCLEIVRSTWRAKWIQNRQDRLQLLEHLTLDECLAVDDFEIEDVTYWRNLKYLSLRGCNRVGMDGIVTIAHYLLELEGLYLCEIAVDDFGVDHIVMNLKKLKELCIAESMSITDRAVYTIAKELPELKMLDISYCEYVTMTGLEFLFGSKITRLIVERTASLTQQQKQFLKNGFGENFVLVA